MPGRAGRSSLDKQAQREGLAITSVTAETRAAGTDGICYLADALADGIEMPLTPHYRAAVLALAGGAADLETARAWVARQHGIA